MKNIQKVSYSQSMLLVFMATAGNLVYIHIEVTAIAGRSGWICTLMASLLVILPSMLMVYTGGRFQGKGILTMTEETLGKAAGGMMSLLYFVLIMLLSATNLSLFAGMVNVYILILTPKWIPILLLLAVCALIAGSGIEVLARLIIIFTVVIFANYWGASILAVVNSFDYRLLLPQFERPLSTYLFGTYLLWGTMIENFLFVAVGIENMPMKPRPYKAVAVGTLFSTLFVVLVPVTFIGILGLEESSRTGYVAANMFHGIQIGRFIQGMEVFVMITYFAIAVGKISINLFIMKTALSHVMGKPFNKLTITVSAVITFVFFYLYISFNKAYLFAIELAKYAALPFAAFILLMAVICLAVGKKKGLTGKV